MKSAGKQVASTAIFMALVTLVSKALGLVRDMLLASTFGTTNDAVAYEVASRLPITLFDFALGGVVTAAFIPIFNELMVKSGKKRAFEFANRYFNLILCTTLVISVLGMFLSSPLVSVLAPDIDDTAIKTLAASLSRVMFPMIIFTGVAYCFVGVLQSFEKYTLPAIMSLVSNMVMVLYFVALSDKFGVWGLSVALVIGWFLQAAIQAPAAYKLGFSFKPTFKFNDPDIVRAIKMAFPILVCSWLQPVCNVINTSFASGFEGGSAINMVGYANRLYIIIVGVFSFVATNLLFPKLSRAEAGGDREGAKKFAGTSIKILLYIMIPLSVGIFLLAEPVTRAIYMRGVFSEHDAAMTASVLKFFAIGIPFMSANEVLTKLFFAMQKVKEPMFSSALAILFNLGLVSLLVKTVGLDGVAIASSLTVALCALLNYIFLCKGGALLKVKDFLDIAKSAIAAVIMGVCVYLIKGIFPVSNDIIITVALGGAGIVVYAVCILILSPTEIRSLIRRGK